MLLSTLVSISCVSHSLVGGGLLLLLPLLPFFIQLLGPGSLVVWVGHAHAASSMLLDLASASRGQSSGFA